MECRCFSVNGYDLFEECVSPKDRTFVAVDGGDTFTVGIEAESGEALGWGRAFYGELLVNSAEKEEPVVKLELPERCKTVACGSNHVLALAYSGRVFAWGCNRSGQVAAAITDEVAAGGMHSLALDSIGRVWAWGCNAYGQLGIGVEVEQHNTPACVVLPAETQVKYIAAGWAHNAIISTSGDVFTFGWGLYNQLGHGATQNELRPLAVEALKGLDSDIAQVACGNWHTAALTESGDLYTWGWGIDGQLGPEASVVTQVLPRLVNISTGSLMSDDNEDVSAVACGNRFTIALCMDGTVHYWGWPHQSIRRICKLAAGHWHAIMLLEPEINETKH